ncbi:MAG: hypothetical protein GY789_18200 [Hyphomicrobiales bacterium]|nr:hypothetical protein [Hyphomicrobiales bacterium]MCP5000195.1 hypothetical protein [Hyphomicrobiales bacterium]
MMVDPQPEILVDGNSKLTVYRDAPAWDGKRTAALGQFKFGSVDGGRELIARTSTMLKAEGFSALIAPMDGDTWHSYRAVSESDGSPAFLMEPESGPHDVAVLAERGFKPISGYVSMRVSTVDAITEQPHNAADVEVINWDGQQAEDFFGEVYDFSVEGFARNAFYKPITRDEFLGLYMPYVAFLKKELIFFARKPGGQLVGFLFGIPDYTQGPQTKTAILKTYASSQRGVGHLLADAFHRNALEVGFDTTIHALMHDDNISRERSRMHGADVFRRYALYGRVL